ncbi:MAG: hypothetical protein K0R48_1063 [Gammaproteobacteria bacterium]|jgi:hypothetical protein|nr:hypothetical protein [Gammaproteobacteria bacterium]
MANSNEDVIGKVQEITTRAMEDVVTCIGGVINDVGEHVKDFGIEHFRRIILRPLFLKPPFASEQPSDLGRECPPQGETTVLGGEVYALIVPENSNELEPPSPRM